MIKVSQCQESQDNPQIFLGVRGKWLKGTTKWQTAILSLYMYLPTNIWPILMKVAQLVFLYRTHTDLVFHGYYLDKCIDLIESFHAIHSFP